MADTTLTSTPAPVEIGAFLGLGGASLNAAPEFRSEEDVSVAGVMMLSAMSVFMAVMAMVTLALFIMGAWWLVSHIPVPHVVTQLLSKLGWF